MQDCAGTWGGDLVVDDCGVCDGGNASQDDCGVCDGNGTSCLESIISLGAATEGTLEVFYSSSEDIGGFQFGLDGATATDASGGAAADAGFTITVGSQFVLGFSFDGSSIPAGEGLLTTLSLASYSAASDACLSDIVVSSPAGSGLERTEFGRYRC